MSDTKERGKDVNENEPNSGQDKKKIGENWEGSGNLNAANDAVSVTDLIPVPPDGGYGWVIVMVAFYCNFVVDGICYAFGNFRPILQQKFPDASEAAVAFIGSSLVGTYLLVGPIVSSLVNKFGPKIVVTIGGTISCVAFLASTLVTNVYAMIVVFGILGGAGFGFIYLPAIVVVCFFFEKKRSLATGIAVAGSGTGNIIMPQIIALLRNSSYTINCVVLSGFTLSCILAASLYKTLHVEKKISNENNSQQPLKLAEPPKTGILRKPHMKTERPKSFDHAVTQYMKDVAAAKEKGKTVRLSLVSDIADLNYKFMRMSVREYARSFAGSSKSGRFDPDVLSKPLTRSDIFFQGSIHNLREFQKEGRDFRRYRESQTFIMASVEKIPQENAGIALCKRKKPSVVSEYLDLIKEPILLILVISNIVAMLGFYVPFVFPTDLARTKGVAYDDAKLLVSIIGFFNTLGRLLFGWLADRRWLTPLTLNNIALACCGILTILCPFFQTYAMFVVYAVLFGTFGAAYICLTSVILTDLLGLNRLTNAFGILILGRSIGCFFGTPVGGALKDATATFDYPFYFSGLMLLSGGIACCLTRLFLKREEQQPEERTAKELEMTTINEESLKSPAASIRSTYHDVPTTPT